MKVCGGRQELGSISAQRDVRIWDVGCGTWAVGGGIGSWEMEDEKMAGGTWIATCVKIELGDGEFASGRSGTSQMECESGKWKWKLASGRRDVASAM